MQIIQLKLSWLSRTLGSRNDGAGERFHSHQLTVLKSDQEGGPAVKKNALRIDL